MERSEVEKRVAAIMERHLAKVDHSVFSLNDFHAGQLYIQHSPDQLAGVKEAAMSLAYESNASYRKNVDYLVDREGLDSVASPKLFWFFSRFFSEDQGEQGAAIAGLSTRLMQIDYDDATEWGQGFFAFGEGKGRAMSKKCINPGEAAAAWDALVLRESIGKGHADSVSKRDGPRL